MSALAVITEQAQQDETLPEATDAELFIALVEIAWALAIRRRHTFRAVAMALLIEGPSDTAWRKLRYQPEHGTKDVIEAGGRRLTRLLGPRP